MFSLQKDAVVVEDKAELVLRIMPTHRWVIDRLSLILDVSTEFIQDAFLSTVQMDVFDSFFKANERKCVVIFHPVTPAPTETERVGSGKSSIPKPFIVTADSEGKLNGEGQIVYMTRVTGKACTQSNVDAVCYILCFLISLEFSIITKFYRTCQPPLAAPKSLSLTSV